MAATFCAGSCNCSHRSSRNLIVSLHVYLASVGIVGDLDVRGDVRLACISAERRVADNGCDYGYRNCLVYDTEGGATAST